jgi:hypothetical protein
LTVIGTTKDALLPFPASARAWPYAARSGPAGPPASESAVVAHCGWPDRAHLLRIARFHLRHRTTERDACSRQKPTGAHDAAFDARTPISAPAAMTPQQELALADQQVVWAEWRLSQQLQRIAHLQADGQDTQLAEEVSEALKWGLRAMQAHRQLIADEQVR